MEWWRWGLSNISLDADRSATAISPNDIHVTLQNAVTSMLKPVGDELVAVRRKLEEHLKHHTIGEINTRQANLNQRNKDRQFCISAFVNKVAQ